jgi:pimeloyl-ACP methyl ester carboxylesterase
MREASPADVIKEMDSLLPPVDREAMGGAQGENLASFMQYGLRQADGWIDDDLAFARDWEYDLAGITVPAYIWQGSEDLAVPAPHADVLGAAIRHAEVRRVDGAGHISLVFDHIAEVLDDLVRHL